jgi:membrane protein
LAIFPGIAALISIYGLFADPASIAGAWIAVSVLFSWYVAHFGSYNKTYGSLGAIMGFMTWIWISLVIILVGSKFDAEIGHRRPPR